MKVKIRKSLKNCIMKEIVSLVFLYLFIGINLGLAQSDCIEEISTIEDNPTVFGIGLKDHYLYVNPGSSQIKIYDISNPENPTSVGQISYSGNYSFNLDILGNYLYIYGGPENSLRIFDITNPIFPIELGTLQLPYGIWPSGHLPNYSYMITMDTIYIVNTTDKNLPFIENKVSYLEVGIYGLRDIFVSSDVLYIGIENGVLIYDNSNQALPVFHSLYANGSLHLAVDTNNNRLYSSQEWGSNNTHYMTNIDDQFNPNLIFQGYGGSSSIGKLLVNNEILIQTGIDNGNQAVSFYKIQGDSTAYIEDFLGSIEFSITDMDAVDSLYIISKNGGIEILKYNGCVTTNISNSTQYNNIELYPNPTQNILTVSINDDLKGVNLKIMDCYGKTLVEQKITNMYEKIDLQNLNSGLYIIVLTHNGKNILSKKIVKE